MIELLFTIECVGLPVIVTSFNVHYYSFHHWDHTVGHHQSLSEGEAESGQLAGSLPYAENALADAVDDSGMVIANYFILSNNIIHSSRINNGSSNHSIMLVKKIKSLMNQTNNKGNAIIVGEVCIDFSK